MEFYRAVVDEAPVVRAATYATTLRVQAVRVAGRWQRRWAASGCRCRGWKAWPRRATAKCGWCAGTPAPAKAPLNPGEFDYRRYLEYRQIYHQQYIHPDQYRQVAALRRPAMLVAVSMRAARCWMAFFGIISRPSASMPLRRRWCWALKDEWTGHQAGLRQHGHHAHYGGVGLAGGAAVCGDYLGCCGGCLAARAGFRYWSARRGAGGYLGLRAC